MNKTFEIIRFYSLDEILNIIDTGGDYPKHHAWCYDNLIENGININCIEYNKNTFLNKIGKKLGLSNLQQQINCIKLTKKNDIVFAPFIRDVSLLALLKFIRIYKTQIIAISHYGFVPYQKNILKNYRMLFNRNIYFKGLDKVLFLNKNMYDFSNSYRILQQRHSYLQHWGVDFSFFNSYSINQKSEPTNDFVFSTGGTNRDFITLIEAFKKINFKLKIAPKHNSDIPDSKDLLENIETGTPIPLNSYGLIRNDFYNCIAVAIPLSRELDFFPTGSTVLFEAMAMGKAIITTKNKAYPFDVEEEKTGINVDYGDIDGWINAVNYLISHPKEAIEMGKRGKHLCETKFNYNLFSNEIREHLSRPVNI